MKGQFSLQSLNEVVGIVMDVYMNPTFQSKSFPVAFCNCGCKISSIKSSALKLREKSDVKISVDELNFLMLNVSVF